MLLRFLLELMPGGKMTAWKGKPPRHLMTNNLGFVKVRVRVPMMNIPILPVRHETGRLIFPVGEFTGIWEWSEVELALKHGAEILEWGPSYWFEPVDMFSDYVKDLYRYRDKSLKGYDEGLAALAKLLLNSTYGKFGMKTLRREVYSWDNPNCPDEALPASNSPDSLIWYVEKEVDACYIMPHISARITSLSRQRLWNFMHQAEELGGRVYYSDTDSVITDVEMPTSTDLGELKDEYPEYSGHIYGEFLGPKLYMLLAEGYKNLDPLENVRAKGFTMPRDFDEDGNKIKPGTKQAIFESIRDGGEFKRRRLEKVGQLARVQFSRGPREITVPKKLHTDVFQKREMLADGSTRPLVYTN